MEKAADYLAKFRQATTPAERQAVLDECQRFAATLNPDERGAYYDVMSDLWPGIWQRFAELDRLTAQLDDILTTTKADAQSVISEAH